LDVTTSVSEAVPENLPTPGSGLRGRLLRGSLFELSGYGIQQVLRLGSNLILTRLLFPAAFGLASIVSLFLTGLIMLSDVAVGPCIIQSKRGDELAFLNTGFTLQAVRGPLLALLMILLAKPAAWFYRDPHLTPLICFGSLQLIINGLHSTSVFTLRRSLRLGWVNGLELGQTLIAVPLTILLARIYPSPWALVIGSSSGALVYTVASHFLPVPYRNRFHWDRSALLELRQFGRWVLGSSAATFFGGQSDRILLGRFLGVAWLGIYSVATNLSDALGAVILRLVNGVMYPALSEAGRSNRDNISDFYYRLRKRLDLLSMTGTGFLAGAGGWIVEVLWDRRYTDAAWILQVLCVRVAVSLIVSPSETCLFSLGLTRYGFQRSVIRLVASLAFLPAGWYLAGVRGVIWGTVATELSTVLAVWPKCRSLGILRIGKELRSIAIFGACLAAGTLVRRWLPHIHLR
jgi:O-antigen/teichoic acid export membrane protein